ncbi:uncharacterized protein FOMMEDRAFT_27303 [Fomitiporia mediterranea MF3/22]|uniref:uncharacterized protein n=1 Tax=Fomitiporia mediterranea (strain MF3/22) TaxID=694068 RepID=UPI0004409685|nr:uncharacterized protein FOMMEDRAFT_27303 [Fomitiporia mediterranea MF3/22]EJD05056.1 hypothetical protein FOMMEDRAFT_27303 [Fomitiporia mediterranea MF3/22]
MLPHYSLQILVFVEKRCNIQCFEPIGNLLYGISLQIKIGCSTACKEILLSLPPPSAYHVNQTMKSVHKAFSSRNKDTASNADDTHKSQTKAKYKHKTEFKVSKYQLVVTYKEKAVDEVTFSGEIQYNGKDELFYHAKGPTKNACAFLNVISPGKKDGKNTIDLKCLSIVGFNGQKQGELTKNFAQNDEDINLEDERPRITVVLPDEAMKTYRKTITLDKEGKKTVEISGLQVCAMCKMDYKARLDCGIQRNTLTSTAALTTTYRQIKSQTKSKVKHKPKPKHTVSITTSPSRQNKQYTIDLRYLVLVGFNGQQELRKAFAQRNEDINLAEERPRITIVLPNDENLYTKTITLDAEKKKIVRIECQRIGTSHPSYVLNRGKTTEIYTPPESTSC